MSYLSLFFISFTIALSGALVPGPLFAAVIYQSTKQGFKTGPLIILGHGILEIAMIAFITLGFSRFINSPAVLKSISVAGALVLIIFGISMLRETEEPAIEEGGNYGKSSNLIMLGLTLSISNPHWTIWWMTVGLGLLLAAQKVGPAAIAVFFAGHILADLGWYSIISFTVSRGKKFISKKVHRGIIYFCAMTLVGFGIYLGINSFKIYR